jgi:hypothetical protein
MNDRRRWLWIALIAVLALASSWNGIYNGFTYDDQFVVLSNPPLHDIHNWWRFFGMAYWPENYGNDGYRPFTILLYSIQWAIGHGAPMIFHAVNIALYMMASVAVFFLAETCLPFAAAWFAAALYAVHPVHVEAVANVVGQSELLVVLCIVSATAFYIRRRNAGELTLAAKLIIALVYAIACLSKEHGFVLPVVLAAAELSVVVDRTPLRQRLLALRPFALGLMIVSSGYILAHAYVNQEITGFHTYVPFAVLGVGASGRVFTMLGLVPEWLRLFLWPATLSAEYGPPQYPVVAGFHAYQVPGLICLIGVVALGIVTWRKAPAISFGIWFMIITLLPTSNFLVPTGLLIAERTLLTPTVGAMIAVAALIPWLYARLESAPARSVAVAAGGLLIAAGAWRSYERTKVWKDDESLFVATVEDAPYVYRSHFMLGAWRMSQKRKVQGEREYFYAMSLYEKDPYLFYSLGEEYRQFYMYHHAVEMYRKALDADSTIYEARARMAIALAGEGDWEGANREAIRALSERTLSTKAMLTIIRLSVIALHRPKGTPPPSFEEAVKQLRESRKPPVPVQKARSGSALAPTENGKVQSP